MIDHAVINDEKGEAYNKTIIHLFNKYWIEGVTEVCFKRNEIIPAARAEGVKPPDNLGDLIYYYRHRQPLPEEIKNKAPDGTHWIIRSGGRSVYCLVAVLATLDITPNPLKIDIKVPDSTPGIIARYAKGDEQALLAKLRYNRLIDIFTGLSCYSLQNHFRTTVNKIGQVETDEIYVALDSRGVHYVIPVQAKGGRDQQNVVQIEHDVALCKQKFPGLICRPIAAQFMANDLIALFDFVEIDGEIKNINEEHYRLVPFDKISQADLRNYQMLSRTKQEL